MKYLVIILFFFGIYINGNAQLFGGNIIPPQKGCSSLSCSGAVRTGTIIPGTAVGAGVTINVPYLGGTGRAYNAQTINSTGVTGLVITLAAGNFAVGNGTLTYTVTGTASGYGTASFPISVGGQYCTLTTAIVPNLPTGTGTLDGKICFDIALSNDNANGCGALASRTSLQANFTQSTTYIQTYTFKPSATVSNVRFAYINTNGNVVVSIAGGNAGNNIASGTAINATVNFSQTLNAAALGLSNSNSLTADIYAIYNNSANNTGADQMVKLTTYVNDCGCCMAKISPTRYAFFLCHNLGANTALDPHTPNVGIIGAYIQWGKRGPNTTGNSVADWQTAPNDGPNGFAKAPTALDPNPDTIPGWSNSTVAPIGSWSAAKTANDPCPSGYRVPTVTEWTGLEANNVRSRTGAGPGLDWAVSNTNYATAYHYGPSASIKTLTLPTAGYYSTEGGKLMNRGGNGYYWTSTRPGGDPTSVFFSFVNNLSSIQSTATYAYPIRCIQEYPATLTTLNCTPTNAGTLMASSLASGVTTSYSYTANSSNFGIVSGSFPSTGVTGLTATITSGNLLSTAAGTIVLTITGTPSAVGTATFNITIGGQSCTFTRTVTAYTIPASITLSQNRRHLFASVNDNNYLPYTAPSAVANLNTNQNPDATSESVMVDVQGVVPTSGVTAYIPVTTSGSGTLSAYESAIVNVPAIYTQDGISRDVQLTWASFAYTASTKSIPVTIKAIGGTLNLKKLDINSGIGNDYLGVLFATLVYPYNSAGASTNYYLHDIAGIPDKRIGLADNSSNPNTHMMIYLPTVAEDGNIWLNNNLGANYSNINHASFNPAQQATANNDFLAYGSLFQWGRKPDAHELINRTGATTAIVMNGTTGTKSDNPTNALFYTETAQTIGMDWRVNSDATLWATESSAYNPCPYGFRVPSAAEMLNLVSASSNYSLSNMNSTLLKLTLAGTRNGETGSLNTDIGTLGEYWTGNAGDSPKKGTMFYFSSGTPTPTTSGNPAKSNGFSVRCIKN